MDNLTLSFALIGFLGIGAQWLAWRFNLPAIVLMALAGMIVGPGLGLINPEQLFGDFYRPIIATAVAVILFEGGLQLKFKEIQGSIAQGVSRLVFPGVPIAWALGSLAAHYLAGLSWSVSVLFAGILVVTGPTVILPLLRQARLTHRPSALLKWEGIINDPIGALLAVIIYEYMTLETGSHTNFQIAGSLFIGAALSIVWGIVLGRFMATAFQRGWVPEYLKPAVLLSVVIICFVLANVVQEEAGLLAVTAMGVTMANSNMPSLAQIRHFKENIAVLFVSGVFVILTASLDRATLLEAFSWQTAAFVAAMLFIVRPLSIMLSTIGSDLDIRERLLAAWVAPRGIVAVAVSSFFAGALVEGGFVDAGRMIPLAFAMVFATVVLHGFTIAPFGKWLGLAAGGKPGFLIVGSSEWAVEFARKVMAFDFPVVIADHSWAALRPARRGGVETYYGEILSEVTEYHLELNSFGYLIALGENAAHNSLVCTDLAPELGRVAIFQINATPHTEHERRSVSHSLTGRMFMQSRPTREELASRHKDGWFFQKTRLTEAYPPEKYLADLLEGEPVLIERKGVLSVASADLPLKPETGDIVLAYVPPDVEEKRQKSREEPDHSEEVKEITDKKKKALDDMPSSSVKKH